MFPSPSWIVGKKLEARLPIPISKVPAPPQSLRNRCLWTKKGLWLLKGDLFFSANAKFPVFKVKLCCVIRLNTVHKLSFSRIAHVAVEMGKQTYELQALHTIDFSSKT